MNLIEALKAVAPAVGDGKIVSQHAFVECSGGLLRAANGSMWALAKLEGFLSGWEWCVRHDLLQKAMDRPDALIVPIPDYGVRVQSHRSRVVVKGTDPEAFPVAPEGDRVWTWSPERDFNTVLADLFKFTAGSDGHIWQQGVHFYPDHAFSANSHALTKCEHGWNIDHAFTLPPWAISFLLAQNESPHIIEDRGNVMSFHWPEVTLRSTRLIEEPPDNIVGFATNLACEGATLVPDNLKETVERVVSYGGTQFKLGEGRLDYRTNEIEIEEEVAIDSAPKVWGTKTMLAALALATEINLSDSPAKWKGGPYIGAFSGLSG